MGHHEVLANLHRLWGEESMWVACMVSLLNDIEAVLDISERNVIKEGLTAFIWSRRLFRKAKGCVSSAAWCLVGWPCRR